MICLECKGLGFLEYEAGLIRLWCFACKGTGVIDGNPARVELSSKDTGEPEVRVKHKQKRNKSRTKVATES